MWEPHQENPRKKCGGTRVLVPGHQNSGAPYVTDCLYLCLVFLLVILIFCWIVAISLNILNLFNLMGLNQINILDTNFWPLCHSVTHKLPNHIMADWVLECFSLVVARNVSQLHLFVTSDTESFSHLIAFIKNESISLGVKEIIGNLFAFRVGNSNESIHMLHLTKTCYIFCVIFKPYSKS